MASPLFDFTHLSPAERIELAEQLWDSLPIAGPVPDDDQVTELQRRRAELNTESDLGEQWERAMDDIEKRGV